MEEVPVLDEPAWVPTGPCPINILVKKKQIGLATSFPASFNGCFLPVWKQVIVLKSRSRLNTTWGRTPVNTHISFGWG